MSKYRRYIIVLMAFIFTISSLVGCTPKLTASTLDEDRKVPTIILHTTTEDYDPIRFEAANLIAQWWGQLGLEVKVIPLEFNRLTDVIRNQKSDDKEWHGFIYSWTGRVERADPDMFIYSISHSSQAGIMGNNFYEYKSPEYDALAEAQRRVTDQEVRRLIVHKAQEILAEDIPFITLFYRHVVQAYNNQRFENFTIMPGEGLYHEWIPFHLRPLTEDKELRIAGTQDLNSFNPLSASTVWEWKLLRLVYDKLVRVSTNFEPEPWAAEKIITIDDTTIDVILREGMTFHDGEPVRPEDVKFTFDYMSKWGISYFDAFLKPIKSVRLLEDGTIRFELVEAYSPFVTMTLAQIPILPQHVWENIVDEEGLNHPKEYHNLNAIGSGPMKLNQWVKDRYISLETYSDYYFAENIGIKGLKYIIYKDSEKLFAGLSNGEADMNAWNLDPRNIIPAAEMESLEVIQMPDIGFHYLGFNLHKEPFNNPAIRKAVAHATDLNFLVNNLLDGYGDVGGAGQSISTGNPFWRNSNVVEYPYDIQLARRILQEAGYEWDDEGGLYYPKQ